MDKMIERLELIEKRYLELDQLLMDPELANDIKRMTQYSKEQGSLKEAFLAFQQYKKLMKGIKDAKLLLKEHDPEMIEMANLELEELEPQVDPLYEKLRLLLLPKDPNDDKNVLVEIRGGAGGDEGKIFAADLFRMYSRYAETQSWKMEVMESEEDEAGGVSFISFMVRGEAVYSKMKFESGAHRVQRVPKTESQGRIHTSTAVVLVMPEAEDVETEINMNDLRIDTYRSSGAGGQHVNTTDSAIRITHIPTGIVVTCQDGRSQHDNKAKALLLIKIKVHDMLVQEQLNERGAEIKSKVGSGDRSEKIRTYNYPQNRVTDHRIGFTIQQLDRVMEGKLDDVIEALITEEQRVKLQGDND